MTATVTEAPERPYLSPAQVAAMIPGMTVNNLAQLRFKGVGPKYLKPSRKVVVYERGTVQSWLKSTERSGTAG